MTAAVSGGGICASTTFRLNGWAIMKMMRSTSRMSIIGITFGSEVTWPRPPPVEIPMSYSFTSKRLPSIAFRSVIAASTRAPARLAISTASWILENLRFWSARKKRILSASRVA